MACSEVGEERSATVELGGQLHPLFSIEDPCRLPWEPASSLLVPVCADSQKHKQARMGKCFFKLLNRPALFYYQVGQLQQTSPAWLKQHNNVLTAQEAGKFVQGAQLVPGEDFPSLLACQQQASPCLAKSDLSLFIKVSPGVYPTNPMTSSQAHKRCLQIQPHLVATAFHFGVWRDRASAHSTQM